MNQTPDYKVLNADVSATLNLQGIKLIEASAGTGKTYTLCNIYIRFILEGRDVAEILIVTFTNAATDELRARIRKRLKDSLACFQGRMPANDLFLQRIMQRFTKEEKRDTAIRQLKLALRSMDEAAIYTIHGFCQRALTDHSFASGQAFDTEIIVDDSKFWDDAIRDWWRKTTYPLNRVNIELFLAATGDFENFCHLQKPLRQAHRKTLLPTIDKSIDELFSEWKNREALLDAAADTWHKRSSEIISILKNSKALSQAAKSPYNKTRLPGIISTLQEYFKLPCLLLLPNEFEYLSAEKLQQSCKKSKRGSDPKLEDEFFIQCEKILAIKFRLQRDINCRALKQSTEFAAEQVENHKIRNQKLSFHDQLVRLYAKLGGADGELLATSLCCDYPVAMVDEFQDTDGIQYGIFRRLYHNRAQSCLLMIGDPKQSIYSFRGSDIFTYMIAKNDAADNQYTLDTNWRSTPPLITAINSIFLCNSAPFVYQDIIEFIPVNAAVNQDPNHQIDALLEQDKPLPPLTVWKIPMQANGTPQNKSHVSLSIARATAGEIARLLSKDNAANITLGKDSVKPSDIAVLVRTSYEGRDIRQALLQVGIHAVTIGHENVYGSEEANDLYCLLRGIVHYSNRQLMRGALASGLLRFTYIDIERIVSEEDQWLEWQESMRTLHKEWQNRGFMSMFQLMLQQHQIEQRMADSPDLDRRLTNLLHLAELLQKASKLYSNQQALLNWLHSQIEDPTEVEAVLRLETDQALVKIVTIHASKGLEYPIVFLPYLWACKPVDSNNGLLAFHNDGQAFLDAGSDEYDEHITLAEKERLAEDVRLTYVAMTRAQSKVYLAWGWVNKMREPFSSKSALTYLLHGHRMSVNLESESLHIEQIESNLDQDLQQLASISNNTIEILELPVINGDLTNDSNSASPLELSVGRFSGHVANDWRVNSFSALTRDIHQTPHGGSARRHDDILNFPAGSRVGLFMHLLMEKLDFNSPDVTNQTIELSREFAPRFNLELDQYQSTIVEWVHNILNTPLDSSGFRLCSLSQQKRLNELEFDFSTTKVNIEELNRLLTLSANYKLEAIQNQDFQGLVTGIVDLIFEYNGKFYIADYKSNYLGGALYDYSCEKLQHAIYERRYDLQYLLYVVALHRYLYQRLANYRYEQHFGGVYYLFLRGMRPDKGSTHGVFYSLPDESLVNTLDKDTFAVAGIDQTP